MPLKHDWWGGFDRMRARDDSYISGLEHEEYLWIAGLFIQRFAEQAEASGWQPAHLLGDRGLARRWAPTLLMPSHIAWEWRRMLFVDEGLPIALQAEADGSVNLVAGEDYTAFKGRQLSLLDIAA